MPWRSRWPELASTLIWQKKVAGYPVKNADRRLDDVLYLRQDPAVLGVCGLRWLPTSRSFGRWLRERANRARAAASSVSLAVVLLSLLASAISAQRAASIPPPRGFVNDFAGVLDAGTSRDLAELITELRSKTGAEIAVVTVRSTQPLSAFDYAMQIAETWKPGRRGDDTGVVFLVVIDDREMFILTGYGVEGALPDGRVGEIRDRLIVPRFKEGNYAAGIRAGTEEIAAILAREYGVELAALQRRPRPGAASEPKSSRHPSPTGTPEASGWRFLVGLLILAAFLGITLWPLLFLSPQQQRKFFGTRFGGGGFGGHGGGFGGGGGGFGGFGGGGFGGGGAGGRW